MPDLIGQSIGRYHILERLGEGGMAVVYKAYDTRLGREVAIKFIRRDAFPAEHHTRIFKRFEREARSLAKLAHPNIVTVIEYGEHETSPFLVMEYISGGILKQKLGKPIPWMDAVQLILPIAQALDYAHKNKIIHRDVKPSNILLTKTDQPKLTDFGIAKVLESDEGATLATTTGVGIGTPEYMAPEQGLGHEVDARADIYSLGIVLYELVAGRKPFRAATPMAVIIKHVNEPLPRPSQFQKKIPVAFEKILFKALAKQPEGRYRNMAEFGKALDGLLESGRAKETGSNKAFDLAKKLEIKPLESSKQMARWSKVIRALTLSGTDKKENQSWVWFAIIMILVVFVSMGLFNRLQGQDINFSAANTATHTTAPTFTIVPTITATRTPHPTRTSTPTATSIPPDLIGLSEDFNDIKYDGAVPTDKWRVGTNCPGNQKGLFQLNGVMNFYFPETLISDSCYSALTSTESWNLKDISYISAEIGMKATTGMGGWSSVGVELRNFQSNQKFITITCLITTTQDQSTRNLWCGIGRRDSFGNWRWEYQTSGFSPGLGVLNKFHMHISGTEKIRVDFWIVERHLGAYEFSDEEMLIIRDLNLSLISVHNDDLFFTGIVDNVILVEKEK